MRVPSHRREADIVIAHHERIDGSGYPRGLRGEQIPIEARILAVADTYDVLISDRPYRKAFDFEHAARILREESGTHLWEPAVSAPLRSLAGRADDPAPPLSVKTAATQIFPPPIPPPIPPRPKSAPTTLSRCSAA